MKYSWFTELPVDAFTHAGDRKIRLHGAVTAVVDAVSDVVTDVGNAVGLINGGNGASPTASANAAIADAQVPQAYTVSSGGQREAAYGQQVNKLMLQMAPTFVGDPVYLRAMAENLANNGISDVKDIGLHSVYVPYQKGPQGGVYQDRYYNKATGQDFTYREGYNTGNGGFGETGLTYDQYGLGGHNDPGHYTNFGLQFDANGNPVFIANRIGGYGGGQGFFNVVSDMLNSVGTGLSDMIHATGTAIAQSPLLSTAAAAGLTTLGVPPAVTAALLQANAGAPPDQIIKAAVIAGVVSNIPAGSLQTVSDAVGGGAVGQAAVNALISGGVAAVNGGNVLQAMATGGVNSGVNTILSGTPLYDQLKVQSPAAARAISATVAAALTNNKNPSQAFINSLIGSTGRAIGQELGNTVLVNKYAQDLYPPIEGATVTTNPSDAAKIAGFANSSEADKYGWDIGSYNQDKAQKAGFDNYDQYTQYGGDVTKLHDQQATDAGFKSYADMQSAGGTASADYYAKQDADAKAKADADAAKQAEEVKAAEKPPEVKPDVEQQLVDAGLVNPDFQQLTPEQIAAAAYTPPTTTDTTQTADAGRMGDPGSGMYFDPARNAWVVSDVGTTATGEALAGPKEPSVPLTPTDVVSQGPVSNVDLTAPPAVDTTTPPATDTTTNITSDAVQQMIADAIAANPGMTEQEILNIVAGQTGGQFAGVNTSIDALKQAITDAQAGNAGAFDRVNTAIAELKANGLTPDQVQTLIDQSSQNLSADLQNALAQSAAGNSQALTDLQNQLQSQIGGVQSDVATTRDQLTAAIQAAQDQGLKGDAALQAGLDSLAQQLGTTSGDLIDRLGTTADQLKSDFSSQLAGVQSDVSNLSAQELEHYNQLSDANKVLYQQMLELNGNQSEALNAALAQQSESFTNQIAGLTADQQAQYDQLTAGQQTLFEQMKLQGADFQTALDVVTSGLGEQIGGVQSNVDELAANVESNNASLNSRIDALMQTGLDQYTATQQAMAEFQDATSQQFTDVGNQMSDQYAKLDEANKTLYQQMIDMGATQQEALDAAMAHQEEAFNTQVDELGNQISDVAQQGQTNYGNLNTAIKNQGADYTKQLQTAQTNFNNQLAAQQAANQKAMQTQQNQNAVNSLMMMLGMGGGQQVSAAPVQDPYAKIKSFKGDLFGAGVDTDFLGAAEGGSVDDLLKILKG